MGIDLAALWGHAGPFARGIVFVLLAMSLMSFTVAIRKLIHFYRTTSATRKFAPQFSRAIQEEQLDQAIALA
ncbi:MAG: MotA/TolQ/ExbB proton channel, partial [Gemmatimonadetes bacterium]|nr:MotA/TolQ/ExbB proton channel [Gemmatimonadota bacterium]